MNLALDDFQYERELIKNHLEIYLCYDYIDLIL